MKEKKIMNKKIIAIIGLMGVGKSTIGAKLAEKLSYYFIDSDQEIEDFTKKTINEIFAENGEKYFREIEVKIIKEIIERDENMVLSLGGGSFMNDEIREILKEKAIVIWLYAPIDTILFRIGNKANRPLLNNSKKTRNVMKDKRRVLEQLALKRYPIYGEADYKFNTKEESHENISNQIIKKIS